MLDSNLIKQLKSVFAVLENEVVLCLFQSKHDKYLELKAMLNDVSSTSEKIKLIEKEEESDIPSFSIQDSNIEFKGIPNGHEFTSLILAILNKDLKGKMPDEGIINRIKNLKNGIKLETYISLSCENCPEVVQALNLISIIHEDFSHTMIDGQFFQDEIKKLNIQGVPSVIGNNELVLAGKNSLTGIIEKLEKKYGTKGNLSELDLGEYDVVVIGGGPAGVSSAIYSARKGFKVAIVSENIGGQVKETKGIENLISVPYIEGKDLGLKLREHVESYDIKIYENRRVNNIEKGDIHKIQLNTNEIINTKSIIVATGARWRKLGIPNEDSFIGKGLAFCPHCDGPFYKGKDVIVVGGGNSGIEAALDLSGIVKSVTVLEFADTLRADKVLIDKAKKSNNIKIIKNAQTLELIGEEKVKALVYKDRETNENKTINIDGVFVQIGLVPNSLFLKDVVELSNFGEIIVDEKNRTNVKGIYAAGDVTTIPYKQIVISVGEGAKAALSVFEDLVLK